MPEGSRTAKGSHIVNLLQLQEGEKVTLMLQQKAGVDEDNTYATMVTKQASSSARRCPSSATSARWA